MKFNKSLEEQAIPEWREKYLDYKQGKKKLEAVARETREIRRADKRASLRANAAHPLSSPLGASLRDSLRDAPVRSFLDRGRTLLTTSVSPYTPQTAVHVRSMSDVPGPQRQRQGDVERAAGASRKELQVDETSPLRRRNNSGREQRPHMTRYGSIIGSPAGSRSPAMDRLTPQRTEASLLELPDPALGRKLIKKDWDLGVDDPDYDREVSPGSLEQANEGQRTPQLPSTQRLHDLRQLMDKPLPPVALPPYSSLFGSRRAIGPQRMNSAPVDTLRPPFFHRIFSFAENGRASNRASWRSNNDVALEAYSQIDSRQAKFFLFLDQELAKIETFYNEKEEDASERLEVLHEQLHFMRNQRVEELNAMEKQKRKQKLNGGSVHSSTLNAPDNQRHPESNLPEGEQRHHFKASMVSQMDTAIDKVRTGHVGETSKAMRDLGTPSSFRLYDDTRDYARRPLSNITYRVAKRKLKIAFVEYYRGLELLKSYALLNHTAFRKINKKCDKTVQTGTPGKAFMSEKVNLARFVNSVTVDELMQSAEDYYSRYFEAGNRKMAISKLRAKGYRNLDYTGNSVRAGFLGGAGLAMAIDGLFRGVDQSFNAADHHQRTNASFLLQIYAGYFLLLLIMILFCFACREFKRHKVNYTFIFEFDGRHHLDWRQLAEMPALFMFLLGAVMIVNFRWKDAYAMYIYWPVVLIGITVVLIVAPLPLYYWKSRQWLLESLWRKSSMLISALP